MANTSVAEKFRSMEYGAAPEDPHNSLVWLDRFGRRFGHFIGGKWWTPARGGRPDHSVELSAPHGGVEDRAGARCRKHGRAEAGGIHAAHRTRICRAVQ